MMHQSHSSAFLKITDIISHWERSHMFQQVCCQNKLVQLRFVNLVLKICVYATFITVGIQHLEPGV